MVLDKQPQALVVDDEAINRKFCRILLQAEGYLVEDASNGLVALEILKQSVHFHLMVLDLRMPVMSGKTVLERLNQMPDHDGMHVIVSTANPAMLTDLNKRYDYTAPKPLAFDEFTTLIRNLKANPRSSPGTENAALPIHP